MTQAATNILADVRPGIFPGVSWPDYSSVGLLNPSRLFKGNITMAHLKAALDGALPDDDTDDKLFGRALHCRLLEPEVYKERYPAAQRCAAKLSSGKNSGKQCANDGRFVLDGAWYCGMHSDGGVEVAEAISQSDALAIEAAALAIKNHPAEFIRAAHGEFEVAIVAELMGELCKGRLDKLIRKPLTIVDVKKVQADSDLRSFYNQIAKYGYGMKAAMYRDMVAKLVGEVPRFYWLIVGDGAPYPVGVIRMSDEDYVAGQNEYRSLIGMMQVCRKCGRWPGFTAGVETSEGPEWWRKINGA